MSPPEPLAQPGFHRGRASLVEPLLRQLYGAVLWLLQPLLRAKLARRGRREPGYLHAVEERLGRYGCRQPAPARAAGAGGDDLIWIHAVSLGETRAAAILLAELRARRPGLRLLLTHGTASGRAEGGKLLRPGDAQAWLPWDTPGAVRRFLARFRPCVGILMETEVWPTLTAGCRTHGVPLALANARLSESSLRLARRLAWLSRPAYGALATVWAQSADDARRLAQLGAPVAGSFGNLKFDDQPDIALLARGRAWRQSLGRPVVVFASSRAGEERELFALLRSNQAREQRRDWAPHHPQVKESPSSAAIDSGATGVQWLVVPRHPQRFDEVAALATEQGLSVSRRSAWGAAPGPADLWLGDSLGEMALYYGLADVALLGGSFAALGGQNLIEAAACGCPVIMGPHTFNFAEAADFALKAGAAQRVDSLAAAVPAALTLAGASQPLATARAAAQAFAAAHRGAATRTAEAVLALLAGPKPPG